MFGGGRVFPSRYSIRASAKDDTELADVMICAGLSVRIPPLASTPRHRTPLPGLDGVNVTGSSPNTSCLAALRMSTAVGDNFSGAWNLISVIVILPYAVGCEPDHRFSRQLSMFVFLFFDLGYVNTDTEHDVMAEHTKY